MRIYATVTASMLLAMGIVGFAFNDQFNIPVYVLFTDLILGLWGMFTIFGKKK